MGGDVNPPFQTEAVAEAYAAFPPDVRAMLLALRETIFDVAAAHEEVGPLTETLKWGQPAYLTAQTKSGTTLRLGISKTDDVALFVHCQTRLVATFQETFPDTLRTEGTRAVCMSLEQELPEAPLRFFIRDALTYHRRTP